MLRRFVAAIGAVLACGSAFAADAAGNGPPPKVGTFTWTGAHVGLEGGWQWGKNAITIHSEDTSETGTVSINPKGAVGGVHLGYNWQIEKFVLGAEADGELSGVDGRYATDWNGSISLKSDWQASIRARLGVPAAPRLLIYGTGGVAFADLNYRYDEVNIDESGARTDETLHFRDT